MDYGFFRAAAASVGLKVADPAFNAEQIITAASQAEAKDAKLVVFPELCVTGYTCGDLFFQESLLTAALRQTERIAKETSGLNMIIAVGLPVKKDGALYNAAAVLFKGKIMALVPKTFIPNYSEFYERRHFSPASSLARNEVFYFSDKNPAVPFGTNILVCPEGSSAKIAFEICEDLWAPNPPSTSHALNGANIVANLSASNEIIGKAEYRRLLTNAASARLLSAYIYADSSQDESSQDMVFAGHNLISENGKILSQSELFQSQMIFADIDLALLEAERAKTTSFGQAQAAAQDKGSYLEIPVHLKESDYDKTPLFFRNVDARPFVPNNNEKRDERCKEVIALQAQGLAKRLRHIKAKSAVIGLSGGLDSTLALLVTCRAFDLCKLDRKGILAVTMPGFGTTDRTYQNALSLAKEAGVSLKEVSIAAAVRQHFNDIGQDESVRDVTYENSQARERTQILMDLANKSGGIVIGTGDLSELALGWCTYNGDHMSMYGVNSSIPKTLVRHLVEWEAESAQSQKFKEALLDVLNTPVSPELLPPTDGQISQKTEELVGPYELHDFFLYNVVRYGFAPSKIYFLASKAFAKPRLETDKESGGKTENAAPTFSKAEIKKWLKTFYSRFFSQQFKRSCMPDGAKVGTVSLSPRGDWRMPSDASCALWLSEIDELL
ncbi:MAG: NAD(+) synthase [Treponema sp.]|nr:NAD(+) synthase [Treponema sp.]